MNGLAQGWLSWLLLGTWQASVLVLVVLIAQTALGWRLSARWRCALWWLVLARLLIPVSLPSPLSLFNLDFLAPPASFQGLAATSTGSATFQSWLLVAWAGGAVWMAIRIGREHLRLRRALVRRRLVTDAAVLEVLEDCKALTRVHAPVVVMETHRVKTPALFGFIRPRLLLPEGMLRSFSREDLRHVFVHELSHLRRHDIAVGWMQALVLTLHWFNPVLWLALHRWRADRELATDELALHHLEARESRDYGATILKLLEDYSRPVPLPAVAGILEDRRQLAGRIREIARFGHVRRSAAVAVLVLLTVAVVTLTDRTRPTRQESPMPTSDSSAASGHDQAGATAP